MEIDDQGYISGNPNPVAKCALCELERPLTFHHLIPRKNHKNKWFKQKFTMEEMKTRGIMVCRRCHSFIHRQFSNKRLGRELNTLEALLDNEVIEKYVKWARKQKY